MHEQVPGEPPRLLVVDDQPHSVEFIARCLADRYIIECACSGPDALALLQEMPLPDLDHPRLRERGLFHRRGQMGR